MTNHNDVKHCQSTNTRTFKIQTNLHCSLFKQREMQICPLSLVSVLSLLHNSEVTYSLDIFATPRFKAIKLSLGFSCIENMLKDQLLKTTGWQFDNWLFGPAKVFGTFEKQAPNLLLCSTRA